MSGLAFVVCASLPAAAQPTPPDPPQQQGPPGATGTTDTTPPFVPITMMPVTPFIAPPVVPTAEIKRLDFNLSAYEAYDDTTVTNTAPGLADPRIQQSGSFSGVSTSLNFAKSGRDNAFNAMAGSDLRYYSTTPTLLPMDYFGGLGFSKKVGRHVSINGSGNMSYSPYYAFGNFLSIQEPNQVVAPSTDQNIARIDTYTYGAGMGLSWSPLQHTSFDASYGAGYVTTPLLAYRLWTQTAGGGFRHQVTRYSELRLGYARRISETGLATVPQLVADDINAGFGYHRPLSFSRRTVVGFDVGSTMVSDRGIALAAGAATRPAARTFYVTGDASLSYQIARTWIAQLSYRRDVGNLGGVAIPFVSDAGTGGVNGLLTRHLNFSATGSFSRGTSAIAVTNGYYAATGSARLAYTVGRYLPVYVEYVYYRYQFDQNIGLAPGFPLIADRQGLRAGLAYSVPLIGHRIPS